MLKSRSGQPVNASVQAPPSIEVVRRRARHRLIGASVLVLAAVVGFSLLFDTQPRPISVDIPIEIPTRAATTQVPPASRPTSQAETPGPAAAPAPAPAPAASAAVKPQEALDDREEVVSEPAPAPAPPPPEPRSTAKTAPAAPERSDDGSRAQSLLDGKSPAADTAATAAAPGERTVVQVGAFADKARAQEVRYRLERAGLKTYTHVANTPEGRRIRVRIGPFDSRQEAEKAAERVKALKLPARILTL
ncbi:MAG: SPOR domain-containing protein [Burkholderiaceae bacterium]